MKFRKKPVVIEAVQILAADCNLALGLGEAFDSPPFSDWPPPDWITEAIDGGVLKPDTPRHTDYADWSIQTLEGAMWARPGDWIIRGVKGEIYPCKPDIFEATYEAAT